VPSCSQGQCKGHSADKVKHVSSNSTQFFIAGTDNIYVGEVDKNGVVTILVFNQTNKGSLLLHLDKVGVVKDENRDPNSGASDKNKPLTTTYQWIEIKFSLDPTKLKNKDGIKQITQADFNNVNPAKKDNTNVSKTPSPSN